MDAKDVIATEHSQEEFEAVQMILETELDAISSKSSSSSSFIFRAPRLLRQVNGRVFEPQIISIGPYYWDKDHLKAMNIHKVLYLRNFIRRTGCDLKNCVSVSLSMEERARNCYAETVSMNRREFVLMMVLDGLFILELFHKFATTGLGEENDDIFKQNLNLTILAQDMLLLENQIPFFVLIEFLSKTHISSLNSIELDFIDSIISFFSKLVPSFRIVKRNPVVDFTDVKHLLGLVHEVGLLSTQRLKHHKLGVADMKWKFILSATELSERGIKFKKGKGNSLFDIEFKKGNSLFDIMFEKAISFFDITFKKGMIHIPTLIVNHDTERILRNLIAYEQLNQGSSIVMDYARLMDCLINYADDVALLCGCGIIDNWLGSHEEVATMFNKINDYVYLSTGNFYYSDLFVDVNEHCNQIWNLWKVKLRQKYFHTPWDWVLMSIVAAVILLLFSLVQTIFSVLAYFK